MKADRRISIKDNRKNEKRKSVALPGQTASSLVRMNGAAWPGGVGGVAHRGGEDSERAAERGQHRALNTQAGEQLTARRSSGNAIVLNLYWGGLPLGSDSLVKSDGRTVTYECPAYGHQSRGEKIPTPAAWEKFWKTMAEVQLWNWKNRYDAPGIEDGLVWGLEIKHGEQKVRSSGHNAYPTLDPAGESRGLPSATFKKYQRAVEELMGRKVWE